MSSRALIAETVFDGETLHRHTAVLLLGDRVTCLCRPGGLPEATELEHLPAGTLLAPGLVDLQVNGGGGVLFNDAPDAAGLARLTAAHLAHGTTSLLATLISGSTAQIAAAQAAVVQAMAAGLPGLRGLHLEGPFLAAARRGIHPAGAIRAPGAADLTALQTASPMPRLITLAPEMVAPALIARLAAAGWRVFAGHSEASAAAARAGFAAGMRGATHLFNAMSPMQGRAPGLTGAVLASPTAFAGIILDLHHVAGESALAALAALGPGRLFLVSDAMATLGSDIAGFSLGGIPIHRDGDRLAGPDGTLAGAHLCLADAVRNSVRHLGLRLDEALRMATATPADALGEPQIGRLRPGARADLVALDGGLAVRRIWCGGVAMPSG